MIDEFKILNVKNLISPYLSKGYNCFFTKSKFKDEVKVIFKEKQVCIRLCDRYGYLEVLGLKGQELKDIKNFADKVISKTIL